MIIRNWRSLCLLVTLLAGCAHLPHGTRHVQAEPAVLGRLSAVRRYVEARQRAGQYSDEIPNTLRASDGVVAFVVLGENALSFVVVARSADQRVMCRYHGGAGGDQRVLCADRTGNMRPPTADGTR